MIHSVNGNLLATDVDAVVNTVNTVGVMGKGIALQFKRAYPDMFKAYKRACERGEVRLGEMWVWHNASFDGPRHIINFPTKGHWRSKSKLRDIEVGLGDLTRVIADLSLTSIALPPLGCGNGGLDWNVVRPLIVEHLGSLDSVDVRLFEPNGAPPARDMINRTERPNMSTGKAALVSTIAQYSAVAWSASVVEVQKLMYFLQEAGEPLNLDFTKARYGPYAENLSKVLAKVEGHFLTGFGDGSKRVAETEPIDVLPGAAEEADAVLAGYRDSRHRIERVLDLVTGYESAYFTELMATVHWIATRDDPGADDAAAITKRVHAWNDRKAGLFTEEHVSAVLDRLRAKGFVPAT